MAGQAETDRRFRTFCTECRLHRPEEFAAVMASTLRLHEGCFELRYCRQDAGQSQVGARLGLIVPKRLARRATLRNLLKRLGREAFRHARPGLPPIDIILRLARPPLPKGEKADPAWRAEWRRSLDALLARAVR